MEFLNQKVEEQLHRYEIQIDPAVLSIRVSTIQLLVIKAICFGFNIIGKRTLVELKPHNLQLPVHLPKPVVVLRKRRLESVVNQCIEFDQHHPGRPWKAPTRRRIGGPLLQMDLHTPASVQRTMTFSRS